MKEKWGGWGTHGYVILLDLIKCPNNFVLGKSNNLFKSNKTTCLCIVWYIQFIRFISYALMYRVIYEHL